MAFVSKLPLTFVFASERKGVKDEIAYDEIRVRSINGRYLHGGHLMPFLDRFKTGGQLHRIGTSVKGRPIEKLVMGKGAVTVMMWSQMHGNESTTTKAVLDLVSFLTSGDERAAEVLEKLTLVVIPMLNPDGAEAYTRENANGIDLNRDAQERTQPESKALRAAFESHSPDFCFNLHDQRTIFSAGSVPRPATLSFLSPAADISRRVTGSRLEAMKVISMVNKVIQRDIPGQIGRYDDAFNPKCVGDTFQMLQTPTILVEAGHYPEDYQREQTRKYVFKALWKALEGIAFKKYLEEGEEGYLAIPENEKKFLDVLILNAQNILGSPDRTRDIGILYKEELKAGSVHFRAAIEKEGNLRQYFGHLTFDCNRPEDMELLKSREEITNLISAEKR